MDSKYRIIDSRNGYFVNHTGGKNFIHMELGRCGMEGSMFFEIAAHNGRPDIATADDVNSARAIIKELEEFIERAEDFCKKED